MREITLNMSNQLSKEKQQSNITLRTEGQSVQKIAKTLNVSPSAVAKVPAKVPCWEPKHTLKCPLGSQNVCLSALLVVKTH